MRILSLMLVLTAACYVPIESGDEGRANDSNQLQRPLGPNGIRIADGNQFRTAREVSIEIQVPDLVRDEIQDVRVEVRKPNGILIYEGDLAVDSDGIKTVRHPIPKRFESLTMHFQGSDWEMETIVPVDADGRASLVIE